MRLAIGGSDIEKVNGAFNDGVAAQAINAAPFAQLFSDAPLQVGAHAGLNASSKLFYFFQFIFAYLRL